MNIRADKDVKKFVYYSDAKIYYEISAVLDGELAVPCTCNPLMQDRSLFGGSSAPWYFLSKW